MHENKGEADIMAEKQSGFLAEIVGISHFWTTIDEFFAENVEIARQMGAKTDPRSVHRFIPPSIHRRSKAVVLDGPMSLWPDGPISPSLQDVFETKGVSKSNDGTVQGPISLKPRHLADFFAVLTRKKIPPKSTSEAGMLLKTNGSKMSAFELSKMLMKINELYPPFQDVIEKKGGY